MSEPVLIGATVLHRPFTLTGKPSLEPGFGQVAWSACGRYSGIVYDRSLDTRALPMCKRCVSSPGGTKEERR